MINDFFIKIYFYNYNKFCLKKNNSVKNKNIFINKTPFPPRFKS
jgi:hypothetical protein